jgi:carboxypeptidase PM20D1
MRRWWKGGALAVASLLAVLGFNAWRGSAAPMQVESLRPALDESALARRLGAAIAIPTLSPNAQAPALNAFHRLHAQLEADFPRLHATLSRELVAGASLLYRWKGRDDCAPLLLLAHQDVVPVEPGTENGWSHAPFSGAVADGAIWGRGALDDKASLLGILEAIAHLIDEDYVPACDVWLAFGHDEETGGEAGAAALSARLLALGVKPAFVLDEGGAITLGTFPGLEAPLATIGVAEKGYLNVRLSVQAEGGHSAMPPQRTAIGRLAQAVARLETQRPAAELSASQRELLHRVAPHLALVQRVILSNLWLTAPLVQRLFVASPAADATLRTTTAPTIFRAGVKDNVLPQQAEAVVNFRLRPGDSVDSVLAHVRDTVDDAEVKVEADADAAREPTTPAPWNDPAFRRIEIALRQASPEPDLVVAPYVSNGGTDARHYAALTPRLYRLVPVKLGATELTTMHGTDERIAVGEYVRAVRFYLALLRGFGEATP